METGWKSSASTAISSAEMKKSIIDAHGALEISYGWAFYQESSETQKDSNKEFNKCDLFFL